jgi:hypothetical protein
MWPPLIRTVVLKWQLMRSEDKEWTKRATRLEQSPKDFFCPHSHQSTYEETYLSG